MQRRTLLATPAAMAVALLATSPTPAAASTAGGTTSPEFGEPIGDRTVRPVTGQAHQNGRPARPGPSTRAVTAAQSERSHRLTVGLLDRTGKPAVAVNHPNVIISNLDRDDVFYWGPPGTVTLPEGRYAIIVDVATPRANRDPSYSIISVPELRLDRSRKQILDARIGLPASVEADDPAARGGGYNVSVYTKITNGLGTTGVTYFLDPRFDEVYAATVPGTQSDTFAFGQARRATEPALELVAGGPDPFDILVEWLDSGERAVQEQANLIAVHAGSATPDELDRIEAEGRAVVVELPSDIAYSELIARLTAIRDRGARLALVIPRGDTAGFADGDLSNLPLPVLVGWGATADRFAAMTRAGATPVTYASRPMPQLRYELAYAATGSVSTPQVYRPRTTELAALPASYHEAAPEAARFLSAAMPFFGSALGAIWSPGTRVPQSRIEYFTPGTWELHVTPYGRPAAPVSEIRDLRAGQNTPIAWDKAVFAPSLRGTTRTRAGQRPWAWRDAGAVDVILPMYGDSTGRPATASAATDDGRISLYRNGLLVDTIAVPDAARFPVPPESATYQLTATAQRNQPWWPLATRIDAEWTFQSSADDDGVALPLLTVQFDPALDLRNQAPGGPFDFPTYITRQDGSPVQPTLVVDASFDDGMTWRPATISGAGDHVTVQVVQPGAGFISLRTAVTDGNTAAFKLTVIRAYALGR